MDLYKLLDKERTLEGLPSVEELDADILTEHQSDLLDRAVALGIYEKVQPVGQRKGKPDVKATGQGTGADQPESGGEVASDGS